MPIERRTHQRIDGNFPALLRGCDARDAYFETETFIENISSKGFYVRLDRCPRPGARLFALVRFKAGSTVVGSGPLFALLGRVLRVEPGPDRLYGAAVVITRRRFL